MEKVWKDGEGVGEGVDRGQANEWWRNEVVLFEFKAKRCTLDREEGDQ